MTGGLETAVQPSSHPTGGAVKGDTGGASRDPDNLVREPYLGVRRFLNAFREVGNLRSVN